MADDRTGIEASKVPEITLAFWGIKIVATTLGEVGGNAVTLTLGLGYLVGTLIFATFLAVAVAAQIKAKRFHPSLYWAVITATTLAGTTMVDLFDRSLGIGYLGGSLSLLALVLGSLGLWYRSEGTVAVETVSTPKVECFYWLTIMFSQTLGTALGDWMADDTPLGYNGSALLIAAALSITAGLYFFTKTSRTALFWAAFILTRPLGATVANSLDKPAAQGGLGISDLTISAVLAALMVVCVLVVPQRAGHHPASA
ncbi:COG4705 family protein [Methylobacterium brachiatum]